MAQWKKSAGHTWPIGQSGGIGLDGNQRKTRRCRGPRADKPQSCKQSGGGQGAEASKSKHRRRKDILDGKENHKRRVGKANSGMAPSDKVGVP